MFPLRSPLTLIWSLALALVLAGPALADHENKSQTRACLAPELARARAFADDDLDLGLPAEERERSGIATIEIVDWLGSGGMGDVHLVKIVDTKGQERFGALKVPRSVQDAQTEAVGNLIHKRLSRIYREVRPDPKDQFIVPAEAHLPQTTPDGVVEAILMPRAGNPVSTFQQSGAMTLQRSSEGSFKTYPTSLLETIIRRNARLAWSQAMALGDLRGAQVVHKDIKGANIVIFGGVNNTIEEVDAGIAHFAYVDFGIAEVTGTPNKTLNVMGTVGHMAPEVLRAAPSETPSDVYAAATVLAENLLGMAGSTAMERGLPWVTVHHPGGNGRLPLFSLNSEGVEKELSAIHDRLGEAKVSKDDLALFDDMKRFIVNGLIRDPVERMKAFAADPKSILKQGEFGADVAYVDRIPKTPLGERVPAAIAGPAFDVNGEATAVAPALKTESGTQPATVIPSQTHTAKKTQPHTGVRTGKWNDGRTRQRIPALPDSRVAPARMAQ